jgi:cytochrome P450
VNEEPGQAHLRWVRRYRNSTGFVTFPVLFYIRQVMPTSSVTIQHITNNTHIYVKPRFVRIAIEQVLGRGILTAEGERHKRQRKALNPAFATSYIREVVHIFSAKATELVNLLSDEVKSQSAQGINLFPLFNRVTLDIISSSGECFSETILTYQVLGTIPIPCTIQMTPWPQRMRKSHV